VGETESVTSKVADAALPTITVVAAVLFAKFGSGTPELTVTVLGIVVPFAVPPGTPITKVKVEVDP
jgi:hypothetical protein